MTTGAFVVSKNIEIEVAKLAFVACDAYVILVDAGVKASNDAIGA